MNLTRTILGYAAILLDVVVLYQLIILGLAPSEISFSLPFVALFSRVLIVWWISEKAKRADRIPLAWMLLALFLPYWPLLWFEITSEKVERYVFWFFGGLLGLTFAATFFI